MEKWCRMKYQPCLPLGRDKSLISASNGHIKFAKEAAAEGMVLLKNNSLLPLQKNTSIAVFGKAQIDYIKGASPFAETKNDCTIVDIFEKMNKKGEIGLFKETTQYYKDSLAKQQIDVASLAEEPEIPEILVEEASVFANVAIITLCRYEHENSDRKPEEFYLTDNERLMISRVCNYFDKVIVLLNIGGAIESEWIKTNDKIGAALVTWYAGVGGAQATVDILFGKTTPSGKLVDTFAKEYTDYPSSSSFDQCDTQVKYYEDIYVGYRYFETIPNAAEKVSYPFGYGLSYTDFEFSEITARNANEKIIVSLTVKNIGQYPGKEVVQVYYSAPQGFLGKPARELAAFKKTKLLKPGEQQRIALEFQICDMSSYDDFGKLQKSAYILEKGEYSFYVGNSVRNTQKTDFTYFVEEDFRIINQLTEQAASWLLEKRLCADGSFEALPLGALKKPAYPQRLSFIPAKVGEKRILFNEVADNAATLDDFIAQLDREYMIKLLGGKPSRGICITNGIGGESNSMTEAVDEFGVPCAMTCDAPEGVSVGKDRKVATTQFPSPTLLACSWDTELLNKYGKIAALEVKENNLSIWLAPGLNIHRDPLCGRNYEYYSEDPLIAGKMAAATVKGVQEIGIAATPKHLAANNRETYRFNSDSIVSERALREIYLKGFEICVKEADPWLIMTAYNIINGVRASENYDIITNILRGEWGYKGAVTSDWSNHANHGKEISAGNDIKMPIGHYDTASEYLRIHSMDKGMYYIQQCVRHLLELLLKLD